MKRLGTSRCNCCSGIGGRVRVVAGVLDLSRRRGVFGQDGARQPRDLVRDERQAAAALRRCAA